MLLLALARDLPGCLRRVAEGQLGGATGFELRGRRLAVVGAGAIGSRFAQMMRDGFGMVTTELKPRRPTQLPIATVCR